jgi:ribosomal subunit interface protein
MQVIISWRHLEHSKELEDRVNTKLAHLEKFSHRISKVSVVFAQEGARSLVELKIELNKVPTFIVKEQGYDMHQAIDGCIKKSERKIKQYESKLRDKKQHQPQQ